MKKYIYIAAALAITACTDDNGIFSGKNDADLLRFEPTMAEQQWYGSVNVSQTRAAATANEDRMYGTNMTDAKGKPYMIQAHTLEGINTNKNTLENPKMMTRAMIAKAIDARSMSVSQVGTTTGNGTTKDIIVLNREARTTDGKTWSCNEFFAHRADYSSQRFFGALFPYQKDYDIKTDNYDFPNNAIATTDWMPYFRLNYEQKEDSAQNQIDLLYAKHWEKFSNYTNASDKNMPLAFRHAMTAVKVKLGNQGFTPAVIKEIRLSGYKTKGTFHFFPEASYDETMNDILNKSGWWEATGQGNGASVAVVNFDTQGEYNTYVTGDAATFMMIPQTLPQGAKMEIDIVFSAKPLYTVNDEGEWNPDAEEWNPDAEESQPEDKVVTLTCDLGGDVWSIGKTREYIITTNENVDGYYMLVNGINKAERTKYISADGGSAQFNISSYKRNADGQTYSALPWKLIGWSYEENADQLNTTLPEWLKLTDAQGNALAGGNGSASGESVNINVGAMLAEAGVSHHDVLRMRESKSSLTDGAYDLSRHDFATGKEHGTTTANCYVIDAPGRYSFPTVYGNAMKDGKVNSIAYGRKESDKDEYIVTDFKDHMDRSIVSPLIQYNTRLSKAVLLWEDVQDMVKNVRLSGLGDFVEFDIDRDHIDQGNAVIGVLDDMGRIAWSWHIWVTDEDITKTVSMGNKYEAMPVNLGWKSATTATAAAGRDIYLVFAQGNNGEEMSTYQTTIRLTQQSQYTKDDGDNMKGSSPYYQWGRKDPLLGSYNGKSIPAYAFQGQSFYTESVTTWTVSEAAVIVEKIALFAATATAGVIVGVLTAGLGTVAVTASVIGGTVVAGGAAAGINVGFADLNDKYCKTTETWGVSLGYAIQHPTADIKSAVTWTDCKHESPYHELWGIGQDLSSDKKVVKTIYDPCPVGFHVPEGDAFNNVKNGSVDKGLKYGDLRLPACGTRIDYIFGDKTEGNYDHFLINDGNVGAYWTARPVDEAKDRNENVHYRTSEGARRFLFGQAQYHIETGASANDKVSITGAYEAWGSSMRPVKDF